MIEKYDFGKMVYNGQIYKSDLIICHQKVIFPWWRTEGHLLQIKDLEVIFKENFDMLVIGQGFSSLMVVPQEIIAFLDKHKKYSFIGSTTQAITVFNEYCKESKVVGAFHITC